jgi:hypothetical protein
MIGLLFLITVAAWLSACIWLAYKMGHLFSKRSWHRPATLVILLGLLAIPFVDEVIGQRQFESLCRAHGIESADVSKARGRKVKVEYGQRAPIAGTIVPIKVEEVVFRDADTGEALIRHKNYVAGGGWVMRYTWLSLGKSGPMLFDGNCIDFVKRKKIFLKNEISQTN